MYFERPSYQKHLGTGRGAQETCPGGKGQRSARSSGSVGACGVEPGQSTVFRGLSFFCSPGLRMRGKVLNLVRCAGAGRRKTSAAKFLRRGRSCTEAANQQTSKQPFGLGSRGEAAAGHRGPQARAGHVLASHLSTLRSASIVRCPGRSS